MTSKFDPDPRTPGFINWIERHPFAIAATFALLFAIQITPQFKMSPDGVSYMSIARNIAQHARLQRLGSPHIRYAPGYPIFISPAYFFGDYPFIAIQILQWIYALALMRGVYVWFAAYAGRSAIWIAALTMASAAYWDLYRTASSEIVSAPSLIWAGAFAYKSLQKPNSLALLISAIVLTAISCATRQGGVMLVPGFFLALIIYWARGKIPFTRAAVLGVTFTLLIGLISAGLLAFDKWGQKQTPSSNDTTYAQIFFKSDRALAGQLAEGLRRQSGEIGRLIIPGMWKTHGKEHDFADINVWIYAAVCIPIAIGWWRFARTTADPLALMLPFYVGLCVVYPYDSGTRFTVPVFCVLAGSLWFLLERFRQRLAIFLILTALHAAVAIGFWISDAAHVRRGYQFAPEVQQVAAKIPPDANVIAMRVPPDDRSDDRWMFLMLFTDRPVAPETTADPVASFVDWIVAPKTEPDSPGFQTVEDAGDYKIEKIISGQPSAR